MQLAQPRGHGCYAASFSRARRAMMRPEVCDSGMRDRFSAVMQ